MSPPPQLQHGPRGTYTRGFLPHLDHEGLLHALTFHLADSLPQSASLRVEGGAFDVELDRGHGSCVLRREDVASVMVGALHYFRADRYELGPWVVMPNHVHAVVRPLRGYGLADIAHSWKSFTAKQINALTSCTGRVWQREYYDRVIRSRRHLMAAARYIQQNPVAAGLVERAEDWPWSSARSPSYLAAVIVDP